MSDYLPGIEAPNGILSYGGGRQTVAICVLILDGRLPRPDRIVMADTGRENPMTFDYLRDVTGPAMRAVDLSIEVVRPDWTPDIYSKSGTLLLPVFHLSGKMRPLCSGKWKRDRMDSFLFHQYGISRGRKWIGFSADETRRLNKSDDDQWSYSYPLAELGITSQDCLEIIAAHGWPQPHRSSCWMCPNKRDAEWAYIRDNYPELWAEACQMDVDVRDNDERGGVWLHHSRKPLAEALGEPAPEDIDPRCETGMCFV